MIVKFEVTTWRIQNIVVFTRRKENALEQCLTFRRIFDVKNKAAEIFF